MGEANLDEFFCPNEACPDYGKKGKGNISAQLRCCGSGREVAKLECVEYPAYHIATHHAAFSTSAFCKVRLILR